MTAPSRSDRIIDVGPPEWCWSRLRDAEEGILSYATPRGRLGLAVPYAAMDGLITIPMAPFNESGWLAADGEVALEVTGTDPDYLRWVVRATGRARRAAPPGAPPAQRGHPAAGYGWPASAPSDRLVLHPVRLRGYYEILLTDEPVRDRSHE